MSIRTPLLFGLLTLALLIILLLDLMFGSSHITVAEVLSSFTGATPDDTASFIVLNFRLPKALTALFAGAGIAIAGLQMQTLFRNPLADTSILGVNSGAGVGVAIYTMAHSLLPGLFAGSIISSTGIIIASCLGSLVVLLIISVVAARLRDLISVLIIGVMIGFIAGAIISILQFFSSEESLKGYLVWSFGSVAGTTWSQLLLMLPLVSVGLLLALLMPKPLNALSLGDQYARSVGVNVPRLQLLLIGITALLTGAITAFTGPIAFLGMAVPHFARRLFRTADHRLLVPATILLGALLLLLCDLVASLPGRQFLMPINALTCLIGAPVVILFILRQRSRRKAFD